MNFTTAVFIFLFLPFSLVFYYLSRNTVWRKIILILCGIVFYAWAEPINVIAILLLLWINYSIGNSFIRINEKSRSIMLFLALLLDVGFLVATKYSQFIYDNVSIVFGLPGRTIPIGMPLGVSFFIFQIVSYIVDLYRKPQKQKFIDAASFVLFYPKLLMGPLMHYDDFSVPNSKIDWELNHYGLQRFTVGLFKKMVVASKIGVGVETAFSVIGTSDFTSLTAIIGAVSYTLYIYFDFSGYADMAIGIAYMFGIKIPENFEHPYLSHSLSEFWRRWHITLGQWFKDYVYFPLGGSRVKSVLRLLFNLLVVWVLTGLWHGASWTFVIWGLYNFFIIAIEKLLNLDKKSGFWGYIYTPVVIILGWAIFRSENISQCGEFITALLGQNGFSNSATMSLLSSSVLSMIFGIVFSFPIIRTVKKFTDKYNNKTLKFIAEVLTIVLLVLSVSYAIRTTSTTFIYNNF